MVEEGKGKDGRKDSGGSFSALLFGGAEVSGSDAELHHTNIRGGGYQDKKQAMFLPFQEHKGEKQKSSVDVNI